MLLYSSVFSRKVDRAYDAKLTKLNRMQILIDKIISYMESARIKIDTEYVHSYVENCDLQKRDGEIIREFLDEVLYKEYKFESKIIKGPRNILVISGFIAMSFIMFMLFNKLWSFGFWSSFFISLIPIIILIIHHFITQ